MEEDDHAIGLWGFTLTRQSLHQTLEPFSNGSHEERSAPLLKSGREAEIAERLLRLVTSLKADRVVLYVIDAAGPLAAASTRLGRPCWNGKMRLLAETSG